MPNNRKNFFIYLQLFIELCDSTNLYEVKFSNKKKSLTETIFISLNNNHLSNDTYSILEHVVQKFDICLLEIYVSRGGVIIPALS